MGICWENIWVAMFDKIKHYYEFDEFRLDAGNPGLWHEGKLVSIPPKVLEILILLVEKRGEIVSREDLMETVWKDTFVEEGNINYTVSLLRKTLDEHDKNHFIQTVPKRGYRFTADVREVGVQSNGFSRENPPRTDFGFTPQAVTPTAPKAQIRWHFIAIILLGLLLVSSFAAWWKFGDQKGLSSVSVSERNIRTVAILPLKSLTEGEQKQSVVSRFDRFADFAARQFESVCGASAQLGQRLYGKRPRPDKIRRRING